MAIMFAPLLLNPGFWVAVGRAAVVVGRVVSASRTPAAAAAVVVGGDAVLDEITSDDDTQAPPIANTGNCTNCGDECPPCVPPVGTIRVKRIDVVPPSVPHHPCAGTHAHILVRHQNRETCKCFWNRPSSPNDAICIDGWQQGDPPPYPYLTS